MGVSGRIVSHERVVERLEAGMQVLVGSAAAEPATLLGRLLAPEARLPADLSFFQPIGTGRGAEAAAAGADVRFAFASRGWSAARAVAEGKADWLPCRFSKLARTVTGGQRPADAVFVRISPPDGDGFCSVGPAADIVASCLSGCRLAVGEVHPDLPRTAGETRVPVSAFHLLVSAEGEPFTAEVPAADAAAKGIARHLAALVRDGTCLAVTVGPVFDALAERIADRKDLGVHTPFFTDALARLVDAGAVTNRCKRSEAGRSLAVYAVGSRRLLRWLDGRTDVVFADLATVFDPSRIGENPDTLFIHAADRVDLAGRPEGVPADGRFAPAFDETADFAVGADLSAGGRTVIAVPSRGPDGRCSVEPRFEPDAGWDLAGLSVSAVVTEHGAAPLAGRSLRERVQRVIDVAHPDDRPRLVEAARERALLYRDQVFIAACAVGDPDDVREQMRLPDGETVRFRLLRSSDEEEMRRLFYRFSDAAVYNRYFSRIPAMPHEKMQDYVNVDCRSVLSVVGLAGGGEAERIVAEARYAADPASASADVAFLVDEGYQGKGVGGFLLRLLARLAAERGVRRFTADVLPGNRAMFRVFERSGFTVDARVAEGAYRVTVQLPAPPA